MKQVAPFHTLIPALLILLASIGSYAQPSVLMIPAPPPWQHQVILDAIEVFGTVADENSYKLKIKILAENSIAASAANPGQGELKVNISQALIAHPKLGPDILRLIICHEIGHLLGGAPYLPLPPEWKGPRNEAGNSLMSSEGQADYYSTATCFRKLAKAPRAREGLFFPPELHNQGHQWAPEGIQLLCHQSWKGEPEQMICERAAMAALGFLTLVADFPISLSEKDESVVDDTITNSYPGRQCRLDTMLAGALCPADLPLDLRRAQNLHQRCIPPRSHRPPCWYKP